MNDLGRGESVRRQVEERIANAREDHDAMGDALWALADIHLASGRPSSAERTATSYLERFTRASTFVGVVRAWARFEQDSRPSPVDGNPFPLVEAGPVEIDALTALSSGDASNAAALFDRPPRSGKAGTCAASFAAAGPPQRRFAVPGRPVRRRSGC
jgi:hypothetical protein